MSLVRTASWGLAILALGWALSTQGATPSPAPEASPEGAGWSGFGLDRVSWLRETRAAGIPLWQWAASLVYILVAFGIARLTDSFVHVWLRGWVARTRSAQTHSILNLLRGPVKVAVFVVLLQAGLQVYQWPPVLKSYLAKGLNIVVAVSICYGLLSLVDVLIGLWKARTKSPENDPLSKELLPLLRKTFKAFILIVAVVVTAQNLGLDVTGLIASLSIGGLAIGLAAQDTLANLFGAVAVLTDKPFRVGDRIQLDGIDGTVESIGFRSTRVRNLDGHLVSVPNKTMGSATIINVSQRPTIKTTMNLGLTYDTSSEKLRRALALLEEICREHPMTADYCLGFDKFADSSLNILVTHWWKNTDYRAYLKGIQEINLRIKERFEAEGIEFAFPSRTLYVKTENSENPVPVAQPGAPRVG